jgi:glucose/arabinose dehydrogenase
MGRRFLKNTATVLLSPFVAPGTAIALLVTRLCLFPSIAVDLKATTKDFLTGFLLNPAQPTTWGRPVGLLVLPDGSLLFTEEANNRIYRIQYQSSIIAPQTGLW